MSEPLIVRLQTEIFSREDFRNIVGANTECHRSHARRNDALSHDGTLVYVDRKIVQHMHELECVRGNMNALFQVDGFVAAYRWPLFQILQQIEKKKERIKRNKNYNNSI